MTLRRRAFLSALGAAGAASFGALPRVQAAPSGASGRPLRLVCVYTPHGRAHELWQPGPGFDLAYPEAVLEPFDDPGRYGKSFKDRLLVLDGVDLSAGIAVGTTGHDGPRAIFTGSGADGKNASIDQFLAHDSGLGAETPHTTLVVGVGNDGSEIGANVSYAAGGTPVPKWIDPSQTFAELFGAPLGKSPVELERERRAGHSVLDAVRADLVRLARRAPASERTKLEQHAQALREIEKRLSGSDRACPAPPAPDRARFPKLRAFGGGEPYLDAVTDLQLELCARALACDLTRFASIFLGDLTRTGLEPELPADVHGDVAHRYDARNGKHAGTPESWRKLAFQNRYAYGKVARLLAKLDEGGVLDDTIVLVSSDMGNPASHSSRSVPTLVVGGAARGFKLGRYLDFRDRPGGGIPNNRLLVSVCQAFGIERQTFGHSADPAIVTGRLEELYG